MKNHTQEKLVIDIGFANLFGIILFIPVILLFAGPYVLIWGIDSLSTLNISYFIVLLFFIGGVVAHELIHGIVWAIYAKKGFRSIRFGILLKMLTPYCHCKEPLKVKHYIAGAIMPAIVLGLIPAIVAIAIGNTALLYFSIFFTVAAGGDILVINLLRKEKMDDYAQDHPSEAGCYIYRENNNKE